MEQNAVNNCEESARSVNFNNSEKLRYLLEFLFKFLHRSHPYKSCQSWLSL